MTTKQQRTLFVLIALIVVVFFSLLFSGLGTPVPLLPTQAVLNMQQNRFLAESPEYHELESGQEFLIQLGAETSQSQFDQAMLKLGIEVVADFPVMDAYVARRPIPLDTRELQQIVPNIIIEPNYQIRSLLTIPTNDPLISEQWSLDALAINPYWEELPDNAEPITVAVIDSGICLEHEDLQGRILGNGYDYVNDDNIPNDLFGHGCAVSGIIAANSNNGIGITGVAPNVKILPIRVLDEKGIGNYADLASAIYYAVDNGADIINLSLGGQNYSQILEQAVNYALDRDVKIVAGTGNSGQLGVYYPARYEGVMAVGSLDANGNQSDFTSYGPELDTLAPGENILTTSIDGQYSYFTGTSMAVPHITGLMAVSDMSGIYLNLDHIISTPIPDGDGVGSLNVPTNTPTPTGTPPNPPDNENISPEEGFRCDDIQVSNILFDKNLIHVDFNQSAFDVQDLVKFTQFDIHYPSISGYPNMYLDTLLIDSYEIWSGDNTVTSPVTINNLSGHTNDPDVLPYNINKRITLSFANSPATLGDFMTVADLSGTLATLNSIITSPHSDCVIDVVTTNNITQCGATHIKYAGMSGNTVQYQVDNVDVASDQITRVLTASDMISGTSLTEITIGNHTLWSGSAPSPIDTSTSGTFYPYQAIDGEMITLYYNFGGNLADYFYPYDFTTGVEYFNTITNSPCAFNFIEFTDTGSFPPPALTVETSADTATLNWTYDDPVEHFKIERQQLWGFAWETVATVASDIRIFDDIGLACEMYRWSVTAYDGTYYSMPSYAPSAFINGCNAPTNLTALSIVSGTQLNWEYEQGVPTRTEIYRSISGVDTNFELIETVYNETNSYLDDELLYCDDVVTYRLVSQNSHPGHPGSWSQMDPVDVEFTPSQAHCVDISPPTDFTAQRVDTGVELSWTPPAADDHTIHYGLTRKVIGQDSDYRSVTGLLASTSYIDTTDFTCDSDQVEYRVKVRKWGDNLRSKDSANVTLTYDEICPRTDLELEITTNNPSPEPYEPVEVTVTIRNTGNETAHDISVRQHDLGQFTILDYDASIGSFSSYWKSWSLNVLQAQSEETITFTLLAQQDTITNQMPISFEIRATDAIDPDSEWDNYDITEDDYALLTLGMTCPTATDLFTVADGDVDGLVRAVSIANYETCFPGQDAIILAQDGYYGLDTHTYYHWNEGAHAFHPISTDVVIQGNRSTIASGPLWYAFYVTETGYLDLSELTITSFGNNNSDFGSVLYNKGTTIINESNITGNHGGDGAVLESTGASANLEIYNSYIDNVGDYNLRVGEDSTAYIENSTLRKLDGLGSFNLYGDLEARFTTLHTNSSTPYYRKFTADGTLTLFGNVFYSGYPSSGCPSGTPISEDWITSEGYNITERCPYDHPTDIGEVESALDGFPQNRGGFTFSTPPSEGSPVIDFIPAEFCDVVRDQNGSNRPQDNDDNGTPACNAGAYENEMGIRANISLDNDSPTFAETIVLDIDIENGSIFDATNGLVTIDAPSGLTFLGTVSGTVSTVNNQQQWVLNPLVKAQTAIAQLQYRVDGPFDYASDSFVINYAFTHLGQPVIGELSTDIVTDCGTDLITYNIVDGDVAGLAQAIRDANNNTCITKSHQINLAPNGDYVITSALGDIVSGATDPTLLPVIDADISIIGSKTKLRYGGATGRLLYVNEIGSLILKGLHIDGFKDGEPTSSNLIRSRYSNLSIIDSEITNNDFPDLIMVGDSPENQFLLDRVLLADNYSSANNRAYTWIDVTGQIIVRNSTFSMYDNDHDDSTVLNLTGNVLLEFNTFYNSKAEAYLSNFIIVREGSYGDLGFRGNIFYDVSCSMPDFDDSLGYNYIVADNSHCDMNHITDLDYENTVNPLILQPLRDNGGMTRTMLPAISSQSVDYIPPEDCPVATDQRGLARPYNNNCDIGAVERTNALNAPTNLIVTPVSGTNSNALQWTDNTSSELTYEVFRSTSIDENWERIAQLGSDVTSYTDLNLNCYQSYNYQVRAVNAGQYSDSSNIVSGITTGCVPLVAPMLNITSVSGTVIPDIEVELSWTDTNSDADDYEIEFTEQDSAWVSIGTSSIGSFIQGVRCEWDYEFRVRATRNADNSVSDWSDVVSFTGGNCPVPPTVIVTPRFPINNNIDYNVLIEIETYPIPNVGVNVSYHPADGSGDWTLPFVQYSTGTPYSTVECGVEYEFIAWVNLPNTLAIQNSAKATWLVSAKHCIELIAPTNLSGTQGIDFAVDLEWSNANIPSDNQAIVERQIEDSEWVEISQLPITQTTFTDTTSVCGQTYNYRIRARNINVENNSAYNMGYSDSSNIITIDTDICAIHTPLAFIIASVDESEVQLTWFDESTIETSYRLFRSIDNQNWLARAILPANTEAFTDTSVNCEQAYFYRLVGNNADLNLSSIPVYTNTITPKCTPVIPDSITPTFANSQTSLSWKPVPPKRTSQIIIERAEQPAEAIVGLSGDLNWQTLSSVPSNLSIFTDFDLKCATNYWYRVKGYNAKYNEYTEPSDTIAISTADCPVPVTNTVGLYRNGQWLFRDGFDDSDPIIEFRFGPQEEGWTPLTGDWDGDGVDGIGIYKNGIFALRDISSSGVVDYVYRFGSNSGEWQPLVGDWNGDGTDTVGIYRKGTVLLTDSHQPSGSDYEFNFGFNETGWTAITGDWYKTGRDLVGIYKEGTFLLQKTALSRSIGASFNFGLNNDTWQAIAGDWNEDGYTTIGLFTGREWLLRNTNSRGTPDITFSFGNQNNVWIPIASYRGGEEAIEGLALNSVIPINVNPDHQTAPEKVVIIESVVIEDTATEEPTLSPTPMATVSGTDDSVELTIIATTDTSPEVTDEPQPESTATDLPTVTPLPTSTPLPTATATPIPTIIPSATPAEVEAEAELTEDPELSG